MSVQMPQGRRIKKIMTRHFFWLIPTMIFFLGLSLIITAFGHECEKCYPSYSLYVWHNEKSNIIFIAGIVPEKNLPLTGIIFSAEGEPKVVHFHQTNSLESNEFLYVINLDSPLMTDGKYWVSMTHNNQIFMRTFIK